MRLALVFFALASLVFAQPAVGAPPAVGVVENFGPNLATTCPNPEGIAADPRGNVYASSFAFKPTANICVLDPAGAIVDVIAVPAGTGGIASLLGMLFVPADGLYVLDFANGTAPNGRVLLVDPATHAIRTIATGFAAPNAIAKDDAQNLYVSDSFRGSITKIAPDGTKTETAYPQLLPAGFPPFGANGVAFDRDERFLYVANTSNDTVYRIAFDAGTLGAISTFAGGIDGADGIAFDARGDLYVCANQANVIAVVAPDGSIAATYAGSGSAAMDFPASLVFRGRDLFITNLSLFDGGVNSRLSHITTPFPGAPLRP